MITINNETQHDGLGYSIYQKLISSKKQENLELIFTKGKLEILLEDVERINVYPNSMNIYFKNKEHIYINLYQITQIK